MQAHYIQISAIEPNLAINFRGVSSAQNRKHVIARVIVVKLLEQYGFLFADFRPQQRIQQMLRAKIFQRLFAVSLQRHFADQKFILRWEPDVELFPIAGHVKNGFAYQRRLSDHANVCGPCGQEECFHFVVFLNQARVLRARGGF